MNIDIIKRFVSAGIPGLDAGKSRESDVLHAYVEQLVADYLLVPSDTGDAGARRLIEVKIEAHAPGQRGGSPPWTWDDAYAIEKALARIEPIDRIRRRLTSAREEYRDLAGDRAYDTYAKAAPVDLQKASEEELRADLLQLLSEIQWIYATVGVQQQVRDGLARKIAIASLLLVVIPAATIITLLKVTEEGKGLDAVPLFSLILLCGALGGLVSTYRRLQGLPLTGNPAVNLVSLNSSAALTYISPLLGAVFAAVLFALLVSGLVGGDIFPRLPPGGVSGKLTLSKFIDSTGPLEGIDYAKLLVWSFIAGFAERLVPDAIDRLSSSTADIAKKA